MAYFYLPEGLILANFILKDYGLREKIKYSDTTQPYFVFLKKEGLSLT
jgi:hypothetical protein